MATKKETEKKKATKTKKATVKKTTAKKSTKKVKEQIEETKPIESNETTQIFEKYETPYNTIGLETLSEPAYEPTKEEIDEIHTKVIETMNGDPSVVTPVEEPNKEVVPVEEPKTEPKKKIMRRINRAIGYFWNGQMIEF